MSPVPLLTLEKTVIVLDPNTGRIGAKRGDDDIVWSVQTLSLPVRAVCTLDDVVYLHMWAGVLEVDLPRQQTCWLVDGEEQPVQLTLRANHPPALRWP